MVAESSYIMQLVQREDRHAKAAKGGASRQSKRTNAYCRSDQLRIDPHSLLLHMLFISILRLPKYALLWLWLLLLLLLLLEAPRYASHSFHTAAVMPVQ